VRGAGFALLVGLVVAGSGPALAAVPSKPNILFILADDLGYGDVHCLNPERGKIATPNLDRLAAQGMTFTDAHSGSSVCTPTRYGILTGRYAWRTRLQSGVLGGFSPPLIEPVRLTVPALLQQHGYATACVGKWHLGLTWPVKGGRQLGDNILGNAKDNVAMNSVDWTQPIQHGPTAIGFDSFFGISASLDMPPFVFLRNDRVTQVPTTEKKWLRSGPAAADFEAVDVLPALTTEAISVIKGHAERAGAGQSFFLYLALTSPHTPILPATEWQGKSGLGDYGDFVMATDAAVGQVLAALDQTGLANHTLVIFTSDNGCSPAAKVKVLESKGHFPSAQFRGYKADVWDGGHRVPLLVRWPDRVKAGARSEAIICLTDFMATAADLLGAKLPATAAEDSFSFLPELLRAGRTARDAIVHHSIEGRFAIRQGPWKLELCPGSGGWSSPKDAEARGQKLPEAQLYDLSTDIGEHQNVQAAHPEVVRQLTERLRKVVAEGRSTAGSPQRNDGAVDMFKVNRPALSGE